MPHRVKRQSLSAGRAAPACRAPQLPVQPVSPGTGLGLQGQERDVRQHHSCLWPLEHPAPMPTWELAQRFLIGDTGAGAEPPTSVLQSPFHTGPGSFQLTTAPRKCLPLHSQQDQTLRKRQRYEKSGSCPSAAPIHSPWRPKNSPQAREPACFQRDSKMQVGKQNPLTEAR